MTRRSPLMRSPLLRAAAVSAAVIAVDLSSKMIAVAALGPSIIPLPVDTFLQVVYNDSFARGLAFGAWSLPATVLLAGALLLLLVRVCAPLADVDSGAPVALGLIGGAAAANATDFASSGRGVVDFLGVQGNDTTVVFNLADVAAYLGVALLARTALRLASAVAAERAAARLEVALALDAAFDGAPDHAVAATPRPAAAVAAPTHRAQRPRRQRPGTAPLEAPRAVPVFREGLLAESQRPGAEELVVLRFPSSVDPSAGAGTPDRRLHD